MTAGAGEAWLTATCPACRIDNRAPARAAGKRARCGDCGTVVRLPAADGPATIDAGGAPPTRSPPPRGGEDGEVDDDRQRRLARSGSQRTRRGESQRVDALREGRQGLEGAWTVLGGAVALSVLLLWGAYASRHDLDLPRKSSARLLALAGGKLGMAGSGLVSLVLTGGAAAFLVQAQGARNRAVATHGRRRRG